MPKKKQIKKKPYYGIDKTPKGKKPANMKESLTANQVKRYGEYRINPNFLNKYHSRVNSHINHVNEEIKKKNPKSINEAIEIIKSMGPMSITAPHPQYPFLQQKINIAEELLKNGAIIESEVPILVENETEELDEEVIDSEDLISDTELDDEDIELEIDELEGELLQIEHHKTSDILKGMGRKHDRVFYLMDRLTQNDELDIQFNSDEEYAQFYRDLGKCLEDNPIEDSYNVCVAKLLSTNKYDFDLIDNDIF